VLVIEDDDGTAEEIVSDLGDRGYMLDRASDGADGLQRARTGGWDVLIVDRMLPGLDGLSVIEALHGDDIKTPVLVLSALDAVNDRVRGLRAGGDDYLAKPFALSEWRRVWKRCCAARPSRARRCCGLDRWNWICCRGLPAGAGVSWSCCHANFSCWST
jgi:DNA-binding response OmpR family regulator